MGITYSKFSFGAIYRRIYVRKLCLKISDRISDDIPSHMKISNTVSDWVGSQVLPSEFGHAPPSVFLLCYSKPLRICFFKGQRTP